mgnify:CR=1 FL=1
MPDRILRKPEVQYMIGLSDPTIWRLERGGKFPHRIRLGGNAVGWFESEIKAWLQERANERPTINA